jgi:hypothetical protein
MVKAQPRPRTDIYLAAKAEVVRLFSEKLRGIYE